MTVTRGIFRQYDIRGTVGKDLTTEAAEGIGRAYAALLAERGVTGEIAVGRDNRPSGPELRDALVRGLTACGVSVVHVGEVPTPLLYWSLHHLGVAGGIQITGSHNPPEYNGFKISVGTQSVHGDELQHMYDLLVAGKFPAGKGTVRSEAIIDRYNSDIAERIGPLARPVKVVVDCGNGVASLVASKLFQKMGISATYIFCDSDGTFPNHHPDPTVVENVQDLIAEVKAQKAEIGIAFDGDGDRIGVVDGSGDIIWGDHILILYARDVLARMGKGQPIIFDVKCSQALADEIERAGGRAEMWKTGHSLIKDRMKQLKAPLAGEMSGHMFFSEGFYGHDDALYAALRLLRIIAASGKTVKELLSDVPKFVSTPELRIEVREEKKFDIVKEAIAHFKKAHEVIDVDGARVLFGDGWGLIRASNTQPVLVARYEARAKARLVDIQGEMEGWLREQGVRV